MSHTTKNPALKYTTSDLPLDSPVGTLAYDTTENVYKSFGGSSWSKLQGGAGSSSYSIHSDGKIDTIYGDIPQQYYRISNDIDSMIIGSSCTSISKQAFDSSSLSKIIIPSTVTTIGEESFSYCSFDSNGLNLTEGLLTIETFAFFQVTYPDQSIDIPSTVIEIGSSAFSSSNITNLNCYVEFDVINSSNSLSASNVTTIHVRSTDSTWTAGSGQTIGGKTGITVIKDL
jgi:hypothetical protein